MFRFILSISINLLLLSRASAGIIEVPADYAAIQAGIDAAVNGDTVLIADGTYYENINFKGKAITVASYYLMDGDTTHINNTIIDGSQPSHADSGSVVYFISGEDTTSVLCGFTITAGTGTFYDNDNKIGGGICLFSSGARIAHNKIVSNSIDCHKFDPFVGDSLDCVDCAGGGIGSWPIQNVHPAIIENNLIESNELSASRNAIGGGVRLSQGRIVYNKISQNATYSPIFLVGGRSAGGGVSISCDTAYSTTFVEIVGNSITHNQAFSSIYGSGIGGGVDIVCSKFHLLGNLISYNHVRGGEAPDALGAGIAILDSKEIGLVRDNIISFNSGFWVGPDGGGLYAHQTIGLTVEGNRFKGNTSNFGGGLFIGYSSGTTISGNEFICNTADGHGGGLYINNCSLQIFNNIITKNIAASDGGGIYVDGTSSEVQIINNTIVADTASLYGGGICSYLISLRVMNSILWDNVAANGAQIYKMGGNTQVAYCDIQGGWNGTGNINADPLFADTLFHLSDSSQCIGAGIDSYDFDGGIVCNCPSTDYHGNPRPNPVDEFVDMGAFETEFKNPNPPVGIDEKTDLIPTRYLLQQNYPNPFNPSTTIEFALTKSAFVTLKVYNLLGEEVSTLIAEQRSAGIHRFNWDARGLASGVYLYWMEAGDPSTGFPNKSGQAGQGFVQVKKLILMQ